MSNEQKLYTIEQAAERLGGISPWTLRKHIERKALAVVHLGRRVFVSSDEIARVQAEGLPTLAAEPRSKEEQ